MLPAKCGNSRLCVTCVVALVGYGITNVVEVEPGNSRKRRQQLVVERHKIVFHFGVGRVKKDEAAAFGIAGRAFVGDKQPLGQIFCKVVFFDTDVKVLHPGVHLYAALVGFGNEA